MTVDKIAQHRVFHQGSSTWKTGTGTTDLPGHGFEFSGWKDEQMSWKTDVCLGDYSWLPEIWFKGPDALKFLESIISNSFKRFEIGQAKHFICCTENGKVASEGVIIRLGEDKIVMQSGTGWPHYQFVRSAGNYNCSADVPPLVALTGGVRSPARLFKFQVQGPKSILLLDKLTRQDLRNTKFMHIGRAQLMGHDIWALRMGMSGELGFELQGPIEHLAEVRDYIFEQGQEFHIRRLGQRTSMINHVEACFPTGFVHYAPSAYGDEGYVKYLRENNLDGYSPVLQGSYEAEDLSAFFFNPYELGWGSRVVLDHEFIGRKALEKAVNNQARKVMTLQFNDADMIDIYASHFQKEIEPYRLMELPMLPACYIGADKVLAQDGTLIGMSLTPGYSYYFRKVLALTVLNIEYSKPGTEVTVVWGNVGERQKFVRATVAPAPYKQDKRRLNPDLLSGLPTRPRICSACTRGNNHSVSTIIATTRT